MVRPSFLVFVRLLKRKIHLAGRVLNFLLGNLTALGVSVHADLLRHGLLPYEIV